MFSVFSKSDNQGNGAIAHEALFARNGYENYSINLPISGIKIKVDTQNEDRYNGTYRTTSQAEIKLNGQKIKKDFATIGERQKVDINKIIHAVVAYDYVRQNDPSQADWFLKAVDMTLKFEGDKINSQGMLDEVFGEGKVNLDGIVEAEVDKRLQLNNEYYAKYNSNSFLGKVKEGLIKMTRPLTLAFDKIKDFVKGPEIDDYYDRF